MAGTYLRTMRPLLEKSLSEIQAAGTFKTERILTSPQANRIISGNNSVLNFCANNYLGLSSNASVIRAATQTMQSHGFGLSSVRFICGTQDIHKGLEARIARFHGTEDTILYSSCFDANGGVFEALLSPEDAIISDALNHASIIDGIRLCKAERYLYNHLDMANLEHCLKQAQSKRVKLIVTDGVFSMDGDFAPLPTICELADKYSALLFVDDSHATGFIGATGRGTPEYFGVQERVDILNSTLGKALGGGNGGYTTGRKEIVSMLRQRSRPYLFSNSLPPAIVGASNEVFNLVEQGNQLRVQLMSNVRLFRDGMTSMGFQVIGHRDSPIVPVMLGDAKLAVNFADEMLKEGIYVIGFSFPVVPKGKARIRVQLSAAHTTEDVQKALAAFKKIGKQLKVLPAASL
jgi:glycine C-acetyltransferase